MLSGWIGRAGRRKVRIPTWLTRPRSQHSKTDEAIAPQVRASFLASDRTYGARRVWRDVLAEGFSDLGVPVFLADIKGDLAGISQKGADNPKFAERAAKLAGQSVSAPE